MCPAGLAAAAEKIWTEREKNIEQMSLCRKKLIAGLKEMEDVVIHGPEDAVPYIVNASFLGIRSEVLLHALESKGIYVSSGSACSSHKRAGSPVLKAIRCAKEEMDSAVRFSFSGMTQEAEIEETLDALQEMIPVLRRFVRK